MAVISLLRLPCPGRRVHSFARTINPAEPRTCERPRRIQKVVSTDVMKPCPHRDNLQSGYVATRVVPVRICTRRDLERSCRPKFCDCPQKLMPKTFGQILCGWAVLGVKGTIAAGFVYWTVAEGIWGDSADTEDFYNRVHNTIQADPTLDTKVPNLEYMKYKTLDLYNQAVIKLIQALIAVPLFFSKKINEALYPCEPVEEEDKSNTNKKKYCFSGSINM